MRSLLLICFVLVLPALAVLGHDLYMAYNNTLMDAGERFYFSDLGWLWVTYEPASYDWVRGQVDTDIWNGLVEPLLQLPAFYVALLPVVFFLVAALVLKIVRLGMQGVSVLPRPHGRKNGFSFTPEKPDKRVRYKRK